MEQLLDAAEAVLPDVVDLRRRIHAEPELGLELPKTQQAVLDALDGLGLDVRTGRRPRRSSPTSGRRDAGGPTILLRADMDALPMPEDTGLDFASTVDGTMHACGHDAHVAMLAGAARVLAARRDELARARPLHVPAGRRRLRRRALHDRRRTCSTSRTVDAVFALHVAPNLPSGSIWTRGGPLMASADVIDIVVTRQGWPRVDAVPRA